VPAIAVLHYLKDFEEIEYTHPSGKTGAGPLRSEYALVDVPSGRILQVLADLPEGEFVEPLG
jgi:hypothetical protein